ncbi:hypothetical protein Droror1_Dr00014788 [Drosera rotundifolia]
MSNIGFWNISTVTDVKVYSLNSDSWRSCPLPKISLIKVPFNQSRPVFVHGSFHWLGERSDRTTTIISFDIRDETYGKDLCLPNEHDHTCMEILAFCSLDDCLCLVTGQDRYWDANEIWVMREYAIRESWSKIYTIKDVLVPVHLTEPGSKDRRGHGILYINKFNSLTWYDLRYESKRHVFLEMLNATVVESILIILPMKGRLERRTKCLHQDSKKQSLFKRLVRCNQYLVVTVGIVMFIVLNYTYFFASAETLGIPSPLPYLSLVRSNDNTKFLTGVSFASGGAGILDIDFGTQRIYDLGARKFEVVGVPPVSCCPSVRRREPSSECRAEENQCAAQYNQRLVSLLERFKSELIGFQYSYLGTYDLLLDYIQNPAIYGFREVKAACCGLGELRAVIACLSISTYCRNRSDHVFWDFYHPTEKAAGLVIRAAFDGPPSYSYPVTLTQLLATTT